MALRPCLGSVVHKTNGSAALPWLCPASEAGAGNGEKSLEAGERTPSLPPELSIYQDSNKHPLILSCELQKSVSLRVAWPSQEERGGLGRAVWFLNLGYASLSCSCHRLLSFTSFTNLSSHSLPGAPFRFLALLEPFCLCGDPYSLSVFFPHHPILSPCFLRPGPSPPGSSSCCWRYPRNTHTQRSQGLPMKLTGSQADDS